MIATAKLLGIAIKPKRREPMLEMTGETDSLLTHGGSTTGLNRSLRRDCRGGIWAATCSVTLTLDLEVSNANVGSSLSRKRLSAIGV